MPFNIKILTITILIISGFNIANAGSIASGISQNEINIDSNFNGTKIILFGAKGDAGDIIVAVRGPKKSFLITKKEKLFGIWHSGQRVKIDDLYSYYALFSTFNNIDETNQMLEDLELGRNNLRFNATIDNRQDQKKSRENEEIYNNFFENFEKNNLYSIDANKIDFLDETLFKVALNFPKNILQGIYNVEIYLIRNDNLLSFQSIPIYVNQVGINAKIVNFAINQPMIYGIIAILIALLFGWIANFIVTKIFRK
jgi:uncharacterized protein (TIGR02186 family)